MIQTVKSMLPLTIYRAMMVFIVLTGLCAAATPTRAAAQAAPATLKFSFAPGQPAQGFTQVAPSLTYNAQRGYGFEPGYAPGSLSAPALFSVALPEGNYTVTVTLGDPAAPSATTIKAEQRRLMLENIPAAAGQTVTRTFTVNVRRPEIPGGGKIKLKSRELAYPNWDDKLTLELSGPHPAVRSVEIAPAPDVPTLFLIGDSTVTDQEKEPWASWGQMLTRFFKPGLAVANYAESGESLRSFIGEKRLDKVLAMLRPGDFVFVQMGHNDQKDKRPDALATYKKNLKRIVAEARRRQATPVLITSMERKAGLTRDTLGGYPGTVIEVAREDKTALIDLHAMSRTLYIALGDNVGKAFQDGTHHNNYGSYELARCVIEGIRQNKLALAQFIADDVKPFDPAHPDPLASFAVPASPMRSDVKPEGN